MAYMRCHRGVMHPTAINLHRHTNQNIRVRQGIIAVSYFPNDIHHYELLIFGVGNNAYRPSGNSAPPSQNYPQYHDYRADQPMPPQSNSGHSRAASTSEGYGQEPGNMPRISVSGGQPQGMFTRNLIGSVAVSAFNLCDTEDKRGIWFVLQDLSVRTEGSFR